MNAYESSGNHSLGEGFGQLADVERKHVFFFFSFEASAYAAVFFAIKMRFIFVGKHAFFPLKIFV